MEVLPYGILGSGAHLCRSSLSIPLLFFVAMAPALADVNHWTKPNSGYWEEQVYWSLGTLPDASQSVLFNNSGWKALAIGANTAQNFPESMRIQELRIESPADSHNSLLMNFSGFDWPLQTSLLVVGTNSSIVMQSSSLEVIRTTSDSSTGNLLLDGDFNHGDYSQVIVHGALDIGRFGNGAYFLTNGTLTVDGFENIGGPWPGIFVQYGGSHHFGSLHVGTAGEFDLYGGEVTATNGITVGEGDYAEYAGFYQYGGSLNADTVINGRFVLNDGIIAGRMSVPSGTEFQRVDAAVLQNGGTNLAVSLDLGHPNRFGGRGFYVLSNGLLRIDSSLTFNGGRFSQLSGLHIIVSNLLMKGTDVGLGIATADYYLEDGILSAGGLTAQAATFQQDGGTNIIAGDLVLSTASLHENDRYLLRGGLLSAGNVIVNATSGGGFRQTGGSNQIAETLTVQGAIAGFFGYTLEGGSLLAKDIYLGTGAFFQHTSGNIAHFGALTLNQGVWRAATGHHVLGPLQLSAGESTNSAINFPSGSSILRLANSSAQPWASGAVLYITNWHGSASGGGETQLFFGSNSNGLTPQQLALVKFSLPGGPYPARLLPTGEVVPKQRLAYSRSGNLLNLTWEPGWFLQSSTNIAGPYQDIQGAASPYPASTTNVTQFFRLRQ